MVQKFTQPVNGSEPGLGGHAHVSVVDLRHEFGDVVAIDGVSIDVAKGEFLTLLGPSGCGKSTTLRAVAGLLMPTSGEIYIAGTCVTSSRKRIALPPERRRIGMVFQSYAIWPHMTVEQNVGYPLVLRKTPKAQVQEKVRRILELVGLPDMQKRPATDLSGGQQQRVALARALIAEPEVLLLDEPLSNLDAKLRETMRLELMRVQRELGTTTIYVTHDQQEALALSDRIAVMNRGKVEHLGTPLEVYEQPQSSFVADFVGTTNILTGNVVELRDEKILVKSVEPVRDLLLWCESVRSHQPGAEVKVSLRPEDIQLTTTAVGKASDGAELGNIESKIYVGTHYDVRVMFERGTLRVLADRALAAETGDSVTASVREEANAYIVSE